MKTIVRFYLFCILLTATQFARSQDFNADIQQALDYYGHGNYSQAAKLFEQWLPVIRDSLGENDTSMYIQLVTYVAACFHQTGEFEKAETLMKEAIRIAKESFGENHPSYGTCLNNLSVLYQTMGRYEEAETLIKEVMRIDKKSLGENHPDYSRDLHNLSVLYQRMGRYEQAESLMKEVVRLFKLQLGESDPKYGTAINNLAQIYQAMGRYKQAESLMKEVMQIDKKSLGENHPDYSRDLNNLSVLYIAMGRFEQAEPLMKEAIRIYKESLGENHPSYGSCLNNLAQLYKEMGLYEQAEPLMKEAMRIHKESLGENHPDYSQDLNNLSVLYQDMGRYEQAELLMKEAIRIYKESLGENHPSYGNCINNLAQLYQEMGRYKQAEPLMKEALQIDKESLGEDHPSYSIRLINLASLYQDMGQYDLAEPLMKEAMRIDKQSLGENHPSFGNCLKNLASLYQAMGRYIQAEPLMKEALRIDKESLGENHPTYGQDLNNLALLYEDMGQYEQVERLMKDASEITKKSFGKNHPDYCTGLNNLAFLYKRMRRYEKAEPLMKEAFGIQKKQIKENIGFLSEKEAEQYLTTLFYNFEGYQSFNTGYIQDHPSTGAFAFDIELYRKGAMLRSTLGVRNRILESGDTALIGDFNRLTSLHKQIDHLYSLDPDKRYDDPAKLEQQANELEKSLAMRSQDYKQAIKEMDYTWKDVQQQLRPDEVVIEFASFDFYNNRWTDSTYYCALILRKEYEYPKLVYLFEEKQINALLPAASAGEEEIVKTYSIKHEESKAKDLYKLIWGPIEPYLEGSTMVDFAVSGQLNRVAFHALTDESGNLLLNKYDLVQLSSTREVALPKTDRKLESIAIFGGIDYSSDTTDMLAMAREVTNKNLPRSVYRSDSTSRNLNLRYLLGTMEEVKEVGNECQEKGLDVKLYSGKQATEEQFRLLGEKKSPTIIHIATHGFYFPEEKQKDREERMRFMQLGQQENQFVYSPDPLIRSGLAMAGANHAWKGEKLPEGVEDGILTARDVSQLNLMNTELVVLSACQTGLGDVKGSEGVYGLQRAFKMAGARYLMMSLWKVPDETTKEFMIIFYGHLSSGMTIRDSYRNTQKEMNDKFPEDPFKWAAFVLVE